MKGLASYRKAKTTFIFHFSILPLSDAFFFLLLLDNINSFNNTLVAHPVQSGQECHTKKSPSSILVRESLAQHQAWTLTLWLDGRWSLVIYKVHISLLEILQRRDWTCNSTITVQWEKKSRLSIILFSDQVICLTHWWNRTDIEGEKINVRCWTSTSDSFVFS